MPHRGGYPREPVLRPVAASGERPARARTSSRGITRERAGIAGRLFSFNFLLSGRGLQLQLDYERELLRAALCHLEAQLLEAAHLREQAGGAAGQLHVSKRQAGTARVVRGLGGRAARRAVVEAERGAVLLEHLVRVRVRVRVRARARVRVRVRLP